MDGVATCQVVCKWERCKLSCVYFITFFLYNISNLNVNIIFANSGRDGNFHGLRRDGRLRTPRPDQDPLFQAYMCDKIREYWIPFVENLELANGRKAIWNSKKSVIMFEGDEFFSY